MTQRLLFTVKVTTGRTPDAEQIRRVFAQAASYALARIELGQRCFADDTGGADEDGVAVTWVAR